MGGSYRETRGEGLTESEGRERHRADKGRDWSYAAPRSQERGLEQILPQSLQEEPPLPTPGFWTSSIHKCERTDVWCFEHPVCGNVTADTGNESTMVSLSATGPPATRFKFLSPQHTTVSDHVKHTLSALQSKPPYKQHMCAMVSD